MDSPGSFVDDPRSFVAFNELLPTPLERGQLVLARHAFDGVHPQDPRLSQEDRDLATLMFGVWPDEVPPFARRKVELVLGRDSGKSELAIRFGIYQALTVDLSSVGAGDTAYGVFIAPDLELARAMIARSLALIESTPSLRDRLVASSRDSITLRRGDGRVVKIVSKAAAPAGRTGRGYPLVFGTIDECGFCRGEGFAIVDEEIVRALTPRLIGTILLLSTPWANEGLFHRLYVKNFGAPIDAIVAKAPTLLIRDEDPIRSAMIASEYETDPTNAAREFGAEFLDAGSTNFFDGLAISNAVGDVEALTTSWGPLVTSKAAGGDLALLRDSSALAFVQRSDHAVDHTPIDKPHFALVETIERKPEKGVPLRLGDVVKDFAAKLKEHGVDRFTTDGHERQAAREHAEPLGVSIDDAPEGQKGKAESYLLLRAVLNEARITLPNDPRLLAQLRAIRSQPQPGGGIKIISPRRGGHGDLVSALVIAVWDANQRPSQPDHYVPYYEPTRFGDQRGY